jgi:hypothetical protein
MIITRAIFPIDCYTPSPQLVLQNAAGKTFNVTVLETISYTGYNDFFCGFKGMDVTNQHVNDYTWLTIQHTPNNIPLLIFMATGIKINTYNVIINNQIKLPLTENILKIIQKRSDWKKCPYEFIIKLNPQTITVKFHRESIEKEFANI